MLDYTPMSEADLDAVTEAERRIYAFPWTRGNFADSLAAGYGAWLAMEAGQMIGYAVMMDVLDEAHLLNISVLPEFQGRGRGSEMLVHLIKLASAKGMARMLLEVRPANSFGLSVYRRHGFIEVGRRRGYYPGQAGREDAIVMARDL